MIEDNLISGDVKLSGALMENVPLDGNLYKLNLTGAEFSKQLLSCVNG